MKMRPPFACLLLALSACASPGDTQTARVPGEHALRIGQSLALPDGSRLTYLRVVADSRCRPEVTCIRAGDADIELGWQPGTGAGATAVLNTDARNLQGAPNRTHFGPWQVALAGLDWRQPPVATVSVAADSR